jgi:hypothetical protein
MNAKQMFAGVGLYVLTALLAAATFARPARFEARTSGAESLSLRGSAEFGAVADGAGSGWFVLALGPESPAGTVVFTWPDGKRPEAGVYELSDFDSPSVRALVVTGSPTAPRGAFRARSGTVTITRSSEDAIQGQFVFEATGYGANDPGDEDQWLEVQGSFTARSGGR